MFQETNDSTKATHVLRGMVYALLEAGFTKHDIVVALGNLIEEATGNEWEKALEHRTHKPGVID